nr:phospholipase-like protein [Tanacetum cinerariifolium]
MAYSRVRRCGMHACSSYSLMLPRQKRRSQGAAFCFMGFELRYAIVNKLLRLVDDLSAWNDFPWGEYMWIELHKRVYNNDSKYRERHLKKLAIMGPTFMPTYTLQGFVFAFKIWLLETYPNSKTWWVEEKNVILRAVAWSDGTLFLKNDYDRLFQTSNVAAECMSVDKNPSCGSDVKAENKESMCVDSSVKVVEQDEFDQNVADKNLIHDFDQTIEWRILLNDEVNVFCLYGYYFTSRMMPSTPECVLINVM